MQVHMQDRRGPCRAAHSVTSETPYQLRRAHHNKTPPVLSAGHPMDIRAGAFNCLKHGYLYGVSCATTAAGQRGPHHHHLPAEHLYDGATTRISCGARMSACSEASGRAARAIHDAVLHRQRRLLVKALYGRQADARRGRPPVHVSVRR